MLSVSATAPKHRRSLMSIRPPPPVSPCAPRMGSLGNRYWLRHWHRRYLFAGATRPNAGRPRGPLMLADRRPPPSTPPGEAGGAGGSGGDAQGRRTGPGRGRLILLVGDDENLRKALGRMLKSRSEERRVGQEGRSR